MHNALQRNRNIDLEPRTDPMMIAGIAMSVITVILCVILLCALYYFRRYLCPPSCVTSHRQTDSVEMDDQYSCDELEDEEGGPSDTLSGPDVTLPTRPGTPVPQPRQTAPPHQVAVYKAGCVTLHRQHPTPPPTEATSLFSFQGMQPLGVVQNQPRPRQPMSDE